MDHIRHNGEVLKKLYEAKRWVVERTASWHNRFRKLLARFEGSWHNRFRKLLARFEGEENYQASVELANCLIVYRAIYW